jgi:hypothetical protein
MGARMHRLAAADRPTASHHAVDSPTTRRPLRRLPQHPVPT